MKCNVKGVVLSGKPAENDEKLCSSVTFIALFYLYGTFTVGFESKSFISNPAMEPFSANKLR